MREFVMCPECEREYNSPVDRRFHAQPNACPVCGPSLSDSIENVVEWLKAGEIVAIKGLGGYHLACDAGNDTAVRKLRQRKRRSDKPFAIMAAHLPAVDHFCHATAEDHLALSNARRPIVLMPRRADAPLSWAVAPGNASLGVMLPYTPLHYLLMEHFQALVMTSGNISEEPIVSREEELPRLSSIADRYLTHNRRIQTRVDDSVVRLFRGREMVLRRSRGYAPQPISLGIEMRQILACGGELKSTFCLTKGHYAILSQHIGDVENYETMIFFRETLEHMQRFFRVNPRVVAHDLHPNYLSTKFALEMKGVERVAVQHHHAHIASCMADNAIRDTVIGIALDGTGYGTDGKIWGGEILTAGFEGFERRFHFRYVPLAGGDAAVREPWRVAIAYLRDAFRGDLDGLELPMLREIDAKRMGTVRSMLEGGLNTVETSSCGRLFDAVSALLNIRREVNFEAQAAIELESAAGSDSRSYPFEIFGGEIDFRPAIRTIVRDVLTGTPVHAISARFHNTVARAIVEACFRVRREEWLNRVCLSGGSFQNMRLLESTVSLLERRGFQVFVHGQVPPNDGGLSLGQAVIASAKTA